MVRCFKWLVMYSSDSSDWHFNTNAVISNRVTGASNWFKWLVLFGSLVVLHVTHWLILFTWLVCYGCTSSDSLTDLVQVIGLLMCYGCTSSDSLPGLSCSSDWSFMVVLHLSSDSLPGLTCSSDWSGMVVLQLFKWLTAWSNLPSLGSALCVCD